MENVTDIFDNETRGGSEDLDVDLSNAGLLLQKLAEEEGVDLNSLSDADVADLLTDLLPGENAQNNDGEPQQKESSAMSDTTVPEHLTYADVAVELAKFAADNGIDLNAVSREEYHDAFSALSERMQDPDYLQAKVAEYEVNEKVAEAQYIGREMALSFIETLQDKEAGARFDALKARGGKAWEAVKGKSKEYGDKAWEGAKKHRRAIAEVGGGAAAAGTGYAAGRVHEKRSFDDAVMGRAREILVANGIDPETGKVAEDADSRVDIAAFEVLRQNGYTFGDEG